MMYCRSRSRSIPFLFALSAAAVLLLFPCALHADDDNPKNDLERDYVALTKVGLDTGAAARLENVTFKRDCLEVTFKSGTLYLSEEVEGQSHRCCFYRLRADESRPAR